MKEREYCKNWRRMFGHTDTIGLEMNAFRAFGRKSKRKERKRNRVLRKKKQSAKKKRKRIQRKEYKMIVNDQFDDYTVYESD